jgi:hypothetical protein
MLQKCRFSSFAALVLSMFGHRMGYGETWMPPSQRLMVVMVLCFEELFFQDCCCLVGGMARRLVHAKQSVRDSHAGIPAAVFAYTVSFAQSQV